MGKSGTIVLEKPEKRHIFIKVRGENVKVNQKYAKHSGDLSGQVRVGYDQSELLVAETRIFRSKLVQGQKLWGFQFFFLKSSSHINYETSRNIYYIYNVHLPAESA